MKKIIIFYWGIFDSPTDSPNIILLSFEINAPCNDDFKFDIVCFVPNDIVDVFVFSFVRSVFLVCSSVFLVVRSAFSFSNTNYFIIIKILILIKSILKKINAKTKTKTKTKIKTKIKTKKYLFIL